MSTAATAFTQKTTCGGRPPHSSSSTMRSAHSTAERAFHNEHGAAMMCVRRLGERLRPRHIVGVWT